MDLDLCIGGQESNVQCRWNEPTAGSDWAELAAASIPYGSALQRQDEVQVEPRVDER